VTTGWSTLTPSDEPASIWTASDQTVGERAMTFAVSGSTPAGYPVSSGRSTIPRSFLFSSSAAFARATCSRSSAFSRFRSSLSDFALMLSPTQPTRSRNGLVARETPVSIGCRTSWAPRWKPWSRPPAPSPKYIVRRPIERATSTASAARLLRTTCLSYIG
jgi:hypothetical protein